MTLSRRTPNTQAATSHGNPSTNLSDSPDIVSCPPYWLGDLRVQEQYYVLEGEEEVTVQRRILQEESGWWWWNWDNSDYKSEDVVADY